MVTTRHVERSSLPETSFYARDLKIVKDSIYFKKEKGKGEQVQKPPKNIL